MRITSLKPLLVALVLAACGGADAPVATTPAAHPGHPQAETPAESVKADHAGTHKHQHGAPEAQESHPHDFPPDVTAFHDVLGPVWHSEATPKPACPNSSKLYIAAENIDPMAPPEGVDPDAWQEAAELLLTSALQLTQACNQMGDEVAAQELLVEMHDNFHALIALIGHEEEVEETP